MISYFQLLLKETNNKKYILLYLDPPQGGPVAFPTAIITGYYLFGVESCLI